MKTQILPLEGHDDVVSVCDRMTWAKTTRVILVWPIRGRILHRRLDLVLLQRHANRSGSQLGLVTTDRAVVDHALDLGIPCFRSVKAAQGQTWRRARRKIFRLHRREGPRPDFRITRPALSGWINPALSSRPARVGLFIVGIAAVLALMAATLPGATIQLQLPLEKQSVRLDITASPEIQAVSLMGQVPAEVRRVVVEARESALSTGLVQVPDQSAKGTVEFTNLTNQGITIPAGTVLISMQGKSTRFLTTREARLSARPGSTIEIPVQAAVPGTAGNVKAGRITTIEGELGLTVSVTNPQPTIGGKNRTNPAASNADLRALRQKLTQTLELSALGDLNNGLQAGDRLIPATLSIEQTLSETIEPPAGQPSDQVTLTLRVEYSAWVIKGGDLRMLAGEILEANRNPGALPASENLVIEDVTTPELDGDGKVTWTILAGQSVIMPIDADAVTGKVAGKPRAAALQTVRQLIHTESDPIIQTRPVWWPWLPLFSHQIQVNNGGS